MPKLRNRTSFRSHLQSIQFKLPAAFTALLALLVAFYVFAAYRRIERSALDASRQRVSRVNAELAQMVTGNYVQRALLHQRQAGSAEIIAALRGQRNPKADSTLARLLVVPDSSAVLLLDSKLETVAHAGEPASYTASAQLESVVSDALEQCSRTQRGPLFVDHGIVRFWTVVVIQPPGDEVGFIAQLRAVRNRDESAARTLGELIGDASVYFANLRGEPLWVGVDGKLVQPPRTDSTESGLIHIRGDGRYIAQRASLPGTPWMIVTEMPVAAARARAYVFFRELLPLAIAVVVVGALLAWMIARRYAQPIRKLSDAAQAIAAGDYARRVATARNDEVGELARTFNDMASQVQLSIDRTRQLNAQLEDRVRQRTGELEAANRELRAFSYSVSHDLRGPLRSMDGFSEALLEDYGASLDDTGKDYLVRIRKAAQRMGYLIDDLLLLSKVTLQPIERESVDLSELARELIADLREAEPARAVEVVIEPEMRVHADRGLMRVVLQNLLANAWKFTAHSSPARIEVGAHRSEDDLEFFVRDNGAGFDMAYAQKLFVPFQRLHTPAEFAGTGIGLATVQRVIFRHGGRVRAVGRPAHGATFYFSVNGAE